LTHYTFRGAASETVLPNSWIWAIVEDIAIIASGQTPKGVTEADSQGEFTWFRVGDMNSQGNETYMKVANVNLTKQEVDALHIRLQPPGTIVFPKRGGAIATNKKRILSKLSAYDLNTMGIYPLGLDKSYFWYVAVVGVGDDVCVLPERVEDGEAVGGTAAQTARKSPAPTSCSPPFAPAMYRAPFVGTTTVTVYANTSVKRVG
jgi:hypothetical protein